MATKGRLGFSEGLAHDADFLLNKVSANGGKIGGNTGGGSMSAVSGAESVVTVDVGKGCKLFCKLGIVLFLFGVETDVFDEHGLSVFKARTKASWRFHLQRRTQALLLCRAARKVSLATGARE